MLRISPHLPLLWRTPTSCQLGSIDPVVTFDPVTLAQERALAVLREGTALVTLRAFASQWGMSAAELTGLLDALAPALEGEPTRSPRVVVAGDGPGLAEIIGVLDARVSDDEADFSANFSADLAVIVGNFFVSSAEAGMWLRRDIPHLTVAFDERGATVGPLVVPGRTPCAHCVELARRDADPSWVAIATQLTYAEHPSPSSPLRYAVAVEVERMVREREVGVYVRLTESGARQLATVTLHDECQCQLLQENVTPIGSTRVNRNPTPTTGSVSAPRA